ncbi:MAG: ABC transporter permease [Planctomycetaceae bacterium]|nr:ABC transporter permease [Planctomycetaceae bacterium]
MALWKYTSREITRRPGRTTLTLLGIALGVAAIVAVSITARTTRRAYRDMFESLTGRAALEVVAEGLTDFDPQSLTELTAIPGVEALVPVVQSPVALVGGSSSAGALALGIDPARDTATRKYVFREGRQVASGDELVLPVSLADGQDLKLGDSLTLMAPTGSARMKIVGLLEPQGAAGVAGGMIVFMPLQTAQRIFDVSGRVNSVQIVLAAGQSEQALERRIGAALPPGLVVQVPAMRGTLAQENLKSTEQGLSSMSFVSLVAGAFVILNTFLMNLGERRKQLAILRALGTTRRQLTRLLLREAFVLGLIGTAVGILFGWGASSAMASATQKLMGAPLPPIRLGLDTILLALALGPGMALGATLVPVRQAVRRPVLEGLGDERDVHDRPQRRWPSLLGLGMVLSDLLLLYGLFHRWFGPVTTAILIPAGLGAFLGGTALALPLIFAPLERFVARLFAPFWGLEGRLALRQLNRRRTRTALTVGVLFIATVVTIGMGNSLLNNVSDVHEWSQRTVTSDFLIRSVMPDTGMVLAAALPPGLDERIGQLPGVGRVDRLSFVPIRTGGQQALLLARSFDFTKPIALDFDQGDEPALRAKLQAGEVVVGTVLAQRLKLQPGDKLTLNTQAGPRDVRVAGTTTEYTGGGMSFYMEYEAARRLLDFKGANVFMVTALPGEAGVLEQSLRKFCTDERLLLQSNAEFHAVVDWMMQGVLGSLWLLMALVFVVASLGIVNTLTMNALEQTREFGVLRAIGMLRGQLRKMVLAEALALGVISVLPAAVAGSGLAWLINVASRPLVGHPVEFRLTLWFVAACCVAAVLTAVLAAILPARRVARLEVVQALQYE